MASGTRLDPLAAPSSEEQIREHAFSPPTQDTQGFVDHLDNVILHNCLANFNPAHRQQLRTLVWTCRTSCIFPRAFVLREAPSITSPHPVTYATHANTFEGTFHGRSVWVKSARSNQNPWPEMLCKEAVLWRYLMHPNILPLLGVTTDPLQLVSEPMTNGNITQYLGGRPLADRVGLLLDIAMAVNYLHSRGIIHGDLKGTSIFVNDSGRACLADFGLSTIVSSDPESAESVCKYYSIRWTAPEIFSGRASFSKETDIYSFGMVVIEVFNGAVPFSDITAVSVVSKVLSGKRPERPVSPALPEELWTLTQRCLEENPGLRPEIAEIVDSLQRTLATQQDCVPVTDTGMEKSSRESLYPGLLSSLFDGFSGVNPMRSRGANFRAFQPRFPWRRTSGPFSKPGYTLNRTCSIKSEEVQHSLRLVGSKFSLTSKQTHYPHGGPRNLFRKARTWLFSCGTPPAHECHGEIPTLPMEQ